MGYSKLCLSALLLFAFFLYLQLILVPNQFGMKFSIYRPIVYLRLKSDTNAVIE